MVWCRGAFIQSFPSTGRRAPAQRRVLGGPRTARIPYWSESRSIQCDTPLISEGIAREDVRRSLVVGFANFADSLALASQGIKVVGVDVGAAGVETYRTAANASKLRLRTAIISLIQN